MSERKRRPDSTSRIFIGDRQRPLLPRELVGRRPIFGTGRPPEELLALGRRRSFVVTGDSSGKPEVTITRVADGETQIYRRPAAKKGTQAKRHEVSEARDAIWRVDITLQQGQQSISPKVRTIRDHPEVYRNGIKPDVGHSGLRPEWMDLLYIPRVVPRPFSPHMRRFNGRAVRPLWVFGPDDRHLYRDTSYPWGCIGSIYSSGDRQGSGVLVGRNIVVTAGHVVPWDWGNEGSMKFTPADFEATGSLYGQNVFAHAVEARGYNTGGHVAGYDWAILKLDQPLGDLIGYMGCNSYTSDWENVNCWTIVGYPSGFGPLWQGGISVNDDDEDSNDGQELESATADITDGDSGGPMFAWWGSDPRIVGVVSGEETENVFFASHQDNVIAGGPGLLTLIGWGRSNW